MGTPYEIAPMSGIQVAGQPVVVEVDWPHRSVISKIIVVQLDGVKEAFTVALFNHPQVAGGQQTSDSLGDDVGPIPDDCYRVTPDLVAESSGKLLYFSEESTGGYGYVVFSQKPTTGRQGQRDNKIYLKITPVAGGDKLFAVCVGGMKEIE